MKIQSMIAAAAIGLALTGSLTGAAHAYDLQPVQSQSIDLGAIAGDAYYTVQPDGFHVTATFADRNGAATPVRIQTTLARGQSVTFSTPRGAGEQPVSFVIKRQNQRVIIAKTALTN